ncbi:hypothetical protein D3C81_2108340 [compost metagenome]
MIEQVLPHLRLLVEGPEVGGEGDVRNRVQTVQHLDHVPVVLDWHHQRVAAVDDDGTRLGEPSDEPLKVRNGDDFVGVIR